MSDLLLLLARDAFWSAIPAVGFAMVFNVPPRLLPYCAFGGAFAHSLRTTLMLQGLSIEWATLIASTTIGFICVWWARRLRVPRPVFSVASIIPMIPGTYAFKTMIAIVELNHQGFSEALFTAAMENGLKALFILWALSVGLAIPALILYRTKPVI